MKNILQEVLSLPEYSHFKLISTDDWRDPTVDNPPFSLSSKGWYNHATKEKGSLQSLITKKKNPTYIYDRSTCEKTDRDIIKYYFKTREIHITDILIKKLKMRINRYLEKMTIVTPMVNADGKIVQLHMIDLDQNYRKIGGSRLLGKATEDRWIMIKTVSKQLLICEGLEDGIILYLKLRRNVAIAGPAVNFKRVGSVAKKFKDVTVVLDNDAKQASTIHSFHLGKSVKRRLPRKVGVDANEAWRNKKFNSWWMTLKPISFEEVEKIRDKTDKNPDFIDAMNEKYSVIWLEGKVLVMRKSYDPMFGRDKISYCGKADLFNWHANKYFHKEDELGNPVKVNKAAVWWSHEKRREYRGFKFDPHSDNESDGFFNLWRGFAYEPKKGDCSLYYKHLLDNVAGGNRNLYEYLLDWMADTVQYPTRRTGISIVLRGGSGVGKGVAISTFCKLFGIGQHALHVSDAEHIFGKFNGHLKECIVLHGDEAFYAGNHQHEATLKALVTESTRMIELKHRDSFQFVNYTRLMLSSNKDWVVPMEQDDRRFLVIDVLNRMQKDNKYFDSLTSQMDNGGYEALLYDLQKRDISNVNIRDYPNTEAILDNKLNSMDTIDQWIYYRLKDQPFNDEESIQVLYEDYKNSCGKGWISSKLKWSKHMWKIFKSVMSVVRKFKESGRYYRFDDIDECRNVFAERLKTPIDWGD